MIRIALLGALLVGGCQWNNGTEEPAEKGKAEASTKAAPRGEKTATKVPDRPMAEAYVRPGFAVYEQDGRLWIFQPGSEAHVEFLTKGEPAKRVTLVGAGPAGKTIMGAGRDTVTDYRDSWKYAREGYVVVAQDGRLWVFRAGGAPLAQFLEKGEPAKRVTLVGAGPDRRTLMGAERKTLDDYVVLTRYGLEGFAVVPDDGRLWVFRKGTKDYEDFLAKGEPAKRVTLVGAGPDRKTLMGAERETLDAYLAARRSSP